eukprot:17872-Alexandrium_andersonii.AAC.1
MMPHCVCPQPCTTSCTCLWQRCRSCGRSAPQRGGRARRSCPRRGRSSSNLGRPMSTPIDDAVLQAHRNHVQRVVLAYGNVVGPADDLSTMCSSILMSWRRAKSNHVHLD